MSSKLRSIALTLYVMEGNVISTGMRKSKVTMVGKLGGKTYMGHNGTKVRG